MSMILPPRVGELRYLAIPVGKHAKIRSVHSQLPIHNSFVLPPS